MGLAGAIQGHFIGFIAPDNYLSALTFQVWAMLIVGGAGNNLGALLGAVVVWGLWSASSAAVSAIVPPDQQARAASLEIVMIGVLLAFILLVMPRGLLGEKITVSRFIKRRDRTIVDTFCLSSRTPSWRRWHASGKRSIRTPQVIGQRSHRGIRHPVDTTSQLVADSEAFAGVVRILDGDC